MDLLSKKSPITPPSDPAVQRYLQDQAYRTYQDLKNIVNSISEYAVGAIYISVSSTSPASFYGGTWAAFGAGKTLIGLDSGDGDFDVSEETGGAKTHTLTESQIPLHGHRMYCLHTGTKSNCYGLKDTGRGVAGHGGTGYLLTNGNGTTGTRLIERSGGGSSHNNLQPYIVVYMWKKTA